MGSIGLSARCWRHGGAEQTWWRLWSHTQQRPQGSAVLGMAGSTANEEAEQTGLAAVSSNGNFGQHGLNMVRTSAGNC
jgi:hypothetical protein